MVIIVIYGNGRFWFWVFHVCELSLVKFGLNSMPSAGMFRSIFVGNKRNWMLRMKMNCWIREKESPHRSSSTRSRVWGESWPMDMIASQMRFSKSPAKASIEDPTTVVNAILDLQYFPTSWKKAIVILVSKNNINRKLLKRGYDQSSSLEEHYYRK